MTVSTQAMNVRPVPFLPLGGLWEQDDIDAVMGVLQKAARGEGFFPLPEEEQFQNAFKAHEGSQYAIAVNSCGTALDLCMMALNINPGDEVIVPGLTFVCTAGCAAARGAKIVFADIDAATLCLSPHATEAKITPRTKAIVPVHFAGHPADIDAFARLSKKYGVPVIYDAAHAVSAKAGGEPVGGAGMAACYSFQSNKNMTTMGEGGAITTNDAAFAEMVRSLKTLGYVYGPRLRVTQVGFNYRMTKPQAATGLTQLAKIERVVAARLAVFRQMRDALAGVDELLLPAGIDRGHACHLFVIRLNPRRVKIRRNDFLEHLKSHWKIACGIHYPAVWSWEAFAAVSYDNHDTPETAAAAEQVISLPLFPGATFETVQYVAAAIKETIAALKR
jgi:dTDP-4-amino-4,6-dideoxygalactose transaminase